MESSLKVSTSHSFESSFRTLSKRPWQDEKLHAKFAASAAIGRSESSTALGVIVHFVAFVIELLTSLIALLECSSKVSTAFNADGLLRLYQFVAELLSAVQCTAHACLSGSEYI